MGTTTIIGEIIKNAKTYIFNIEDSYTFKNCPMIIAAIVDSDELINGIKDVEYCRGDHWISFNVSEAVGSILGGDMKKVYAEMKESKVREDEFNVIGKRLYITIDYDKQTYSDNEETYSFSETRRYIVEDIF